MIIKYLFLALVFRCTSSEISIPQTVIGGLFDRDGEMRRAFSLAVRTINECIYDRKICDIISECKNGINCDLFHFVKFTALMLEIDDDLINVFKKVEELSDYANKMITNNQNGLSVIIGPQNKISAGYIEGLCELHDLPHIVIRREVNDDKLRSINLYPDQEVLSTVYVKLMEKLNWTSFLILYEKTEHFLSLDKLLKMYGPFAYPVYAIQLGSGPNYSEPLLVAKQKNIRSFVIDCTPEHLSEILKQIQEIGMMTESYHYIITSLDLQNLDLNLYQFSGVNISGIRLVDPDNPLVKEFVSSHLDDFEISRIEKIRTKDALMFDAVAFFAQGFKDLAYEYEMNGKSLSTKYDDAESWSHGLSLRNYILYIYQGYCTPTTSNINSNPENLKILTNML